MRSAPGGAGFCFDGQRHGEDRCGFGRGFHYIFCELAEFIGFILWRFEDEFVVHL